MRITSRARLLLWLLWMMAMGLASPSTHAAEQLSESVDVVAYIKPQLSLTIEPETGGEINFGTVFSAEDAHRLSDPVGVNVSVSSNLGKPYEVTQRLSKRMVNQDGIGLPTGGLLVRPNGARPGLHSELPADDLQTVFVSDPAGQPDTGKVFYQLLVPPKQAAGLYRGTITMTVTSR